MSATEHENPYAPPMASAESGVQSDKLPRFVKVVFILDLIICVYRLLNTTGALVSLVWFRELAFGREDVGRAIPYIIAEIPIGFAVGIAGAIADILGLGRKPAAFKIGLVAASASIAFLVVLIAKFATWLPEIPSKPIGLSMLAGLAAIRLVLAWAYFSALQRFRRWVQRRETQISK